MTEQEQIDALKAQMNCLREVLEQLAKLGNGDKYGNSIGNTIAINALAKTPEQCLAEVKVKTILDFRDDIKGSISNDQDIRFNLSLFDEYVNQLLGQAK